MSAKGMYHVFFKTLFFEALSSWQTGGNCNYRSPGDILLYTYIY